MDSSSSNLNDWLVAKAMDKGNDMSAYETFMMNEKTSKRPSNAAITGVVLGSVGVLTGVAAWIATSTYTHARYQGNAALIAANQATNAAIMSNIANSLATERQTREGQTISLTNYLQGSQQGSQTTSATSDAVAQATAQIVSGAMTGQYQLAPQEVTLVSKKYCPCPCGNE